MRILKNPTRNVSLGEDDWNHRGTENTENTGSSSCPGANAALAPGQVSADLCVSVVWFCKDLCRRVYSAGDVMAGLLSVNVGLPRDITWHGRTVHTSVWKQSVVGRCLVKRLDVVGDAQGDLNAHGGEHRAVLVYQIESYRYWEAQLGRTGFTYGQF